MHLTVIILPLLSFVINTLFGRSLGNSKIAIISTFNMAVTFIISVILFYETSIIGQVLNIDVSQWIRSEYLIVNWGFLFDQLTTTMLIIVNSISFLVHLYSTEYMRNDPHLGRFMSYLSFFTFFMLILVTANNYLQMFVGWEGVGLCSYLLINFFSARIQANKAAIKAMVLNRIGDFGLTIGMLMLLFVFKSLDYSIIFSLAPYYTEEYIIIMNKSFSVLDLTTFFLLIGAIGKSAQLGLHTWLPDAMEGPTPVSALIHAATMVTAGVFMIIRSSPLFEFAPTTLFTISIVGCLTAFFAASTGLLQNDLKRVIAYSTCSQLGYMVFACGVSAYNVAIAHLFNHAFFKALLFLTAGSIIHSLADEQDLRKMGGLTQLLPLAYVMMLIGSLSLMGFPFLTGFYSKDFILEVTLSKYTINSAFCYWLGTLSAFFTAYYSFRLLYYTFLSKPNGYKSTYNNIHESNITMVLPLCALGFLSIFVGFAFKDMMVGIGTNFWDSSIFILPSIMNHINDAENIQLFLKWLPVIFSILGAMLALLVYNYLKNILLSNLIMYKALYSFFNKKWYFDKIYNEIIAQYISMMGYHYTFKTLDRGIIEIIGPFGIADTFIKISKSTSFLQSGYLHHYIYTIFFGAITLVILTSNYIKLQFWTDLRIIIVIAPLIVYFNIRKNNYGNN
uniref:NADH-ubiquinone oxidoreductase chain 5 n=1 Tax=Cyanoptyche gloeocystis TaxID=77922 RepID=A0A096Y6X8_9EUKA|nr:NADH dehydrogenase subunit 5 [Cyanoptyche gloeocystis]AIM52083.1 NADH dehydrogenase subunit 5 [Cyanoptyche gloeocystis]